MAVGMGKIGWVDNADRVRDIHSAVACAAIGGRIVVAPKGLAGGPFCVIEDPPGVTAALYRP